jgi:phage terminase large subunit
VKAIEMRKPVYDAKGELISGNERWWRIYGLGEVGTLDGLVFQNFAICDEMPSEHKWKSYGLDFGFTNDPSALIDVRLAHGELWLDEIIYQTGLTNQDLIQEMAHLKVDNRTEIIADSAEPKSIEEIRRGNFRIRGATKGKDSILNGINLLQGYNINITKTSLNLIKEFRNYQWQQDKHTGDYINKPIDAYCHGIDAIRYVALIKIGKRYNLGAISG